eukprot:4566422-Prymnesium_polylepis.1
MQERAGQSEEFCRVPGVWLRSEGAGLRGRRVSWCRDSRDRRILGAMVDAKVLGSIPEALQKDFLTLSGEIVRLVLMGHRPSCVPVLRKYQ